MKPNAEKCNLLLSSNDQLSVNIDNVNITNNKCEKLQGIHI